MNIQYNLENTLESCNQKMLNLLWNYKIRIVLLLVLAYIGNLYIPYLEDLQKSWISKIENKTIFISALKKEFYEEFKTLLYGEVKKLHEKRYPYNNFLY